MALSCGQHFPKFNHHFPRSSTPFHHLPLRSRHSTCAKARVPLDGKFLHVLPFSKAFRNSGNNQPPNHLRNKQQSNAFEETNKTPKVKTSAASTRWRKSISITLRWSIFLRSSLLGRFWSFLLHLKRKLFQGSFLSELRDDPPAFILSAKRICSMWLHQLSSS